MPKKDQSVKQTILRVRLNDEKEVTEKESVLENLLTQTQVESFTEEELRAIWKNYADQLTDKHLKSILIYLNPSLKAKDTLEIQALNPEQIQYIQKNSNAITEYLASHLRNNQIKLEVKMKETTEEQTPFTAQEKYRYMEGKNPSLKKLVQEFNLRLD